MTNVPGVEINTHVSKMKGNVFKLTWMLITDDFCRFFGLFEECLALKSRIYWFVCYIYDSVCSLKAGLKPIPSGCV